MATTTSEIKIVADTSDAVGKIKSLEGSLVNLAKAYIGVQTVKQIASLADAATTVNNKIKTVTNSTEEANIAFAAIGKVAQSTGQNFEAVGDLYQKIGLQAKNLGLTQQETIRITENFNKALAATGTAGPGAASAIYQFGQALGRGVVAYEDIRQLQESSAGTLNMIAKQFGMTSQEFINAIQKGKVSSEQLALAVNSLGKELDGFKPQRTIGQSIENIRTSFVLFIDNLEKKTGVFQGLATILDFVAKNIDAVVAGATVFLAVWSVEKIVAITAAVRNLNLMLMRNPFMILAVAAATAGTAIYDYIQKQKEANKVTEDAAKAGNTVRGVNEARAKSEAEITKLQLAGLDAYIRKQQAQLKTAGLSDLELAKQKAISDAALELKLTEDQLSKTVKDRVASMAANAFWRQKEADYAKDLATFTREQAALSKSDATDRAIAVELERLRSQYGEAYYQKYSRQLNLRATGKVFDEAERNINQEMLKMLNERVLLDIRDTNERSIQQAILAKQLELGSAFTYELSKQYEAELRATAAAQAKLAVENEITQMAGERATLLIKDTKEREIQQAILQRQLQYGSAWTEELNKQYELELRKTQAARDYAQIQDSLRAYRTGATGAEAAKQAAGIMGQLDPVTQAKTNAESLNRGLEELRNQDLISEQEYQTAKASAAVKAQEEIMSATQKRFETERMYQLQNQQNSLLSYEQQKQAATTYGAFQMKSDKEKALWAIEQGATMFNALGAQNKKAFEIAKAFNIAQAIMNTYLAATKALASYPFPFGMIAAGVAVAAGLAQVAQIRSQQYSGRALGGPMVGGQSYMVGEKGPEIFTPSTAGSMTPNDKISSGATNVTFNILANDTKGFDQLLNDRKGLITKIISDAQLEKGRRQ